MKNKQEILKDIRQYIDLGILDKSDLMSFIDKNQQGLDNNHELKHKHPSTVNAMFYIAGIILFSTIMSIIVQFWETGNAFTHIFLSAIVGLLLWFLSYYLIKMSSKSEIISGLANSLLMTGSLLIIVGSYITVNEIFNGYSQLNYMPFSLALIFVGLLHISFDGLIKRDLILLAGVFLMVSSFASMMFGILQESNFTADLWYVSLILAAALLVYSSRVLVKIKPDRINLRKSFDFFATFVALVSMYIASYGEFDVVWLIVLIISVFAIFSLSVIMQSRELLGIGSFFMVLTIITISFKYFSDLGATFCLIVSTIGLLLSAVIASEINKKYIK